MPGETLSIVRVRSSRFRPYGKRRGKAEGFCGKIAAIRDATQRLGEAALPSPQVRPLVTFV
jgi:hypothetical protein